jgi:hypothetical protein
MHRHFLRAVLENLEDASCAGTLYSSKQNVVGLIPAAASALNALQSLSEPPLTGLQPI